MAHLVNKLDKPISFVVDGVKYSAVPSGLVTPEVPDRIVACVLKHGLPIARHEVAPLPLEEPKDVAPRKGRQLPIS